MIGATDSDFRVCMVSFETLLDIQADAERQGSATRWSSADALRRQVKEAPALLQTLMREERVGSRRAYRCLVLFSTAEGENAGGVATIDVTPERLESLDRLDRDPDVRSALVRMFSLATGGISMTSKG
jgi:hypothetical protein